MAVIVTCKTKQNAFSLRKDAHAIHSDFHGCKNNNFQMKNCDIFLNFAVNTDRGYTVLTSKHNLCLRAKLRK